MSIIGEAILNASVEMLFNKLASSELLQFARQEQIQEDLHKWKKILVKIKAVLNDAEDKQLREKSVKIWLAELRNLAYDVEDMLDEFATEALRRKLLHDHDQPSTSKVRKLIPSCFSSLNPRTFKFNSTMASQMKEITARLQDIARQKDDLCLKEYSGGRSNRVRQRLPTTSLVNEAKVFGREEDQKAIVDLLLRDDLGTDYGVSVIPIVGMGGVGKTTLAQLAYNDVRLEGRFDLKAWVCVSEEFDVIRITKEILLSIGVKIGDVDSLNKLQEELRRQLFKKKFLFVLDDIWNENPNDWTVLCRPFEGGSQKSKIIVTTRNQSVSTIVATLPAYPLKELSNKACLCVFMHSLRRKDFSMHPYLEEICEKIVQRCNGLPLALETLGGLLRDRDNYNDWEEVLNSNVWDLSEEKSKIMPALRVSYYYLPSHLKQCFAYCSIFPKDYEFSKEEIILLWMAEGLLQPKNNEKQMEVLGNKFFSDLKSRSFFQQSNRDMSRYVMHGLINDLAQWVVGEICFRMDNDLDNGIQHEFFKSNLRYLSYIQGWCDGVKGFGAFYKAKLLRTFLPMRLPNMGFSLLSNDILHFIPKLRWLRTLSLRGYNIHELPNTIGELKHLRYLDLSNTNFEILPESISTLYNLQTLLVENCFRLKKLCADIGNLINLHHLNNSNAHSLEEMPLRIGNLTGLDMLPNFVVGNGSGSTLGELKSLKHIKERLCISGLQNVNALDAKKADLNGKRDLNVIVLEWTISVGDSREAGDETQVLDMLRPHQILNELIISGYGGTTFPIWLSDSSFSNLALLTLQNCIKCTNLPSIGQLPFLKHLVIRGVHGVKSVGPEFYNCAEPFPLLETLCFEDMQEWKDWNPRGPDQEVEGFPHLRELSIIRCPKLEGRLPEQLPSLERLVIRSCEQLLVSVPSLPKLCRLEIEECKEVVRKSTVDLSSLNSVVLSDISGPVCPTEWLVQGLSKLEELNITGCNALTSLWQSRIKILQDNSSLCRLVIERCPQLLCLVAEEDEEQQREELPCRLQYLELKECECFVKLPQALSSLIFLTELSIKDCPKLVSFPETGMPPQLRIITIEECNALKSLPEAWMHSSNSNLESLTIDTCASLTYIVRVQLPPNLKQLEISSCNNLGTLIDEVGVSTMHNEITNGRNRRNTCVLERLKIAFCPSLITLWSKSELPDTLEYIELFDCSNLVSLSSKGNLPKALKYLKVEECSKLESIADRMRNLTSLERIEINNLNLKLLPNDLHNLCHLRDIIISNCPNLVSFPEGGLSSLKLTTFSVRNCEKLEVLPSRMHNFTSLKSLSIENCPSMILIPVHGFPTSLTSLKIIDVNICKPLFDWGLHKLTNLSDLHIEGGCLDVVSFPLEETGMMLPTSLTILRIANFPNLERISSDILNLTSLERLFLVSCFKLKSFPKEGLPTSLLQLWIIKSPMLKQRCKKDKGDYRPMIASIPLIGII